MCLSLVVTLTPGSQLPLGCPNLHRFERGRLFNLLFLAEEDGAWSPSQGVAAALHAVGGVPPECAEQRPFTGLFPKFKRWVFVESKMAATTALSESPVVKQSPQQAMISANGKGAAMAVACPVTDPSDDAIRASVPASLRELMAAASPQQRKRIAASRKSGSARPDAPAAADEIDSMSNDTASDAGSVEDRAARLWCTLLCAAWLQMQECHFLAARPQSLDDVGTMLMDNTKAWLAKELSGNPALVEQMESLFDTAQLQVRRFGAIISIDTDFIVRWRLARRESFSSGGSARAAAFSLSRRAGCLIRGIGCIHR